MTYLYRVLVLEVSPNAASAMIVGAPHLPFMRRCGACVGNF
jgi:hypothetical protein